MFYLPSFLPMGFDSSDSDCLNRELVRDHRAPFADATWQSLPGNMSRFKLIPCLQCLLKILELKKKCVSGFCWSPAKSCKTDKIDEMKYLYFCMLLGMATLQAQTACAACASNGDTEQVRPWKCHTKLTCQGFWGRCKMLQESSNNSLLAATPFPWRTVVSATPPKPKMPPSWSNKVWSRWCLHHNSWTASTWSVESIPNSQTPDLRRSSPASRRKGTPTWKLDESNNNS